MSRFHHRHRVERPHLVRVVLPDAGADVTETVEDLLHDRLDGRTHEVDGTVRNPSAAEVWVYTADVRGAIEAARAAIADVALPVDSHLMVRMGDLEPARFEIR